MKLFFSLLVLIAFLGGSISNHKLIAKIKTSLNVSELEISNLENNDIFDIDPNCHIKLLVVTSLSEISQELSKLPFVEINKKNNLSLNSLYLAQAPPAHS
jgi:hypothetical protein